MNLRRAVTPFLFGFFRYKNFWSRTSGSWCQFWPYGFSETNNKYKHYGPFARRLDSIEFVTEKLCPAIVRVSPENEIGGSGIIIDSVGTVLTLDRNVFSKNSRSKINVSLQDGRQFSGTNLVVNNDSGFALLKIQSKSPLPIATLGSMRDCKNSELISIDCLLRRRAYPRSSNQNEVVVEGNFMLRHEELIPQDDYEDFCHGRGGGPIVNFDGKVVGISTFIQMLPNDRLGIIYTSEIMEALCQIGYAEHDPWSYWQMKDG